MGHERFSGSMKLSFRRAVVEHAPKRAPHIDRIENDVACRIVEGLNECPCEVENDRALAAFTRFGNKFGERHGLAGSGRTDEHGVALLEPPRPAYTGEMCGLVMACFGQRRRARKPPLPAKLAAQFFGPECLVVTLDFFFEFVERNKHCAALVLALL